MTDRAGRERARLVSAAARARRRIAWVDAQHERNASRREWLAGQLAEAEAALVALDAEATVATQVATGREHDAEGPER